MSEARENEIKELIGFHCIQLIESVRKQEHLKAEEHHDSIKNLIKVSKQLYEERIEHE